MRREKMTDKELEHLCESVRRAVHVHTNPTATTMRRLLGHISALEAEHEEFLSRLHEALGTNDGAIGVDIITAAEELRRQAEESNRKYVDANMSVGEALRREEALRLQVQELRRRADKTEQLLARTRELEARRWIQCTTVSGECSGGCRSMREHDRYTHGALMSELTNLRPLVVLHEDMTRQKREAESRLAAIRQLAGEAQDMPGESSDNATAVWRLLNHAVGDDAPPQTGDLGAVEQRCASQEATAPMTDDEARPIRAEAGVAEAFAAVRDALDRLTRGLYPTLAGEASSSISLLERRMGAMAQAAREVLDFFPTTTDGPSRHSAEAQALSRLRSALTDATDVFTLNEIEQALRREELGPATARRVRDALSTLRGRP